MASHRILIVDDEKLIRLSLAAELKAQGYDAEVAETAREGLERFGEGAFDLVLLDYRLPDHDGLFVLKELLQRSPELPVILMTAYSTVETAVEAIKLGAFDYINKPFDEDELLIRIGKALETTSLRREVRRFTRTQQQEHGLAQVVGKSRAMQALLAQVQRVIPAGSATVLIRGESGTGKDVLARAIHFESERARAPFVNVTCTAIPDHLLESELFGHEKGAFTDARQLKRGLLEQADGGTVFLDEIGDMSVALQAKLLRFLEEKSFRRVGGARDITVEVRVIAATNRDLEDAVQKGQFRPDLYYRLKVVQLEVPPLRERAGDAALLADSFVRRFARELRREVVGIAPDALAAIVAYPWPGNVRELKNAIERAMILGHGSRIEVHDLPSEVVVPRLAASPKAEGLAAASPGEGAGGAWATPAVAHAEAPAAPHTAASLPAAAGFAPPPAPAALPSAGFDGRGAAEADPLARKGLYFDITPAGIDWGALEEDLIRQALDLTAHNQSRAAKLLGISRDQLRYRMERMGMLVGTRRGKRKSAKPGASGS